MRKDYPAEKHISAAAGISDSYAGPGRDTSRQQKWGICLIAGSVILGIAAVVFIFIGNTQMEDFYNTAREEAYNGIYQAAFDFAETRNHVSNYAVITVEGIQEKPRLEVLTVSGSEFVIKNKDNKDKTTSWLEVQGVGVFTVDLSAGEFIVDTERKFVTVRVPKPVLTECAVTGTGKRFWNNGGLFSFSFFNGSIAEGVQLSQEQMCEGRIKLEDSMRKNRVFNETSKEAAVNMIKSLVQEWNPDVPDLQVEVEFMESA